MGKIDKKIEGYELNWYGSEMAIKTENFTLGEI